MMVNGHIKNLTGIMLNRGTEWRVQNSAGTSNMIICHEAGEYVRLFNNNVERMRTVSTGVQVYGEHLVSGNTTVSGGTMKVNSAANPTIDFGNAAGQLHARIFAGGTSATFDFNLYDEGGNARTALRVEEVGTGASSTRTAMTREKSDARYASISDLKYKEKIDKKRPDQQFWDLETFYFEYGGELAEDDVNRGTKKYGFDIDELKLNFPEAVKFDEFVDPVPLIAALFAETKVQRTEIELLKARLDALEAKK